MRHSPPPETMMRTLLALLTLASTGVAAPVPKDKVKDTDAIVGHWKLVEVQLGADGEKPRDDDTGWKTAEYLFDKDGGFQAFERKRMMSEGKFKLDPSAKVKAIDLTTSAEHVTMCVYELDGDRLTLCLSRSTTDKRPTELKADAKTATHIWVFERIKQK